MSAFTRSELNKQISIATKATLPIQKISRLVKDTADSFENHTLELLAISELRQHMEGLNDAKHFDVADREQLMDLVPLKTNMLFAEKEQNTCSRC